MPRKNTMSMITAREAASHLGLSQRTIYDLAASGELACYRFGASLRFEIADLDEYKTSCRSASMPTKSVGAISLAAQLKAPGSALADYFQRAGVAPKRRSTTGLNQRGFTRLQLASPSPHT